MRRLERGLAVWRGDPQACLLVTGGAVWGRPTEALAMRGWLTTAGVPSTHVRCEDQARNTYENVVNVVGMLRDSRAERLSLVTESYHLRRCQLLMQDALKNAGFALPIGLASAPDDLAGTRLWARRAWELYAARRDLARLRARF